MNLLAAIFGQKDRVIIPDPPRQPHSPPNRLEIRTRQSDSGQLPVAFGSQLKVLLNGEPLPFWQRVSLDLNHDEFVVADIEIAVGELFASAEAALILSGAVKNVAIDQDNGEADDE